MNQNMDESNESTLGSMSFERIKQAFDKTKRDISVQDGNLVLVTEDHYKEALELLKEGFSGGSDEPMSKSVNLKWTPELENMFITALKCNLSIMYINANNGEPMGIRVTRVVQIDDKFDANTLKDEAIKKMFAFMKFIDNKIKFNEHYKCKEFLSFYGLTVSKKYRQRGLGSKLLDTAVIFSKNLGIAPLCLKGECSSNFSQRIYEKAGFDYLAEIRYIDYKVDGKVVMDDTGEHKSLKCYGYRITDP